MNEFYTKFSRYAMRLIFSLALLFCFQTHAQSFDSLIGKKLRTVSKYESEVRNKFQLEALDTLIHELTYGASLSGGEDF